MTMGSLLRFANTVGAAWAFSRGDMISGVLCVIAFGFVTWLEFSREEEQE